MDFKGKVVLITGASSGIGAATAVHFAKLNASLAICGRRADKLQETADECRKASNGAVPLQVLGDLSSEKDVEKIFKKTLEKYGKLDVLVNNAGFMIKGGVDTMTLKEFNDVFSTNVSAVIQLTQLALPELVKSKGNVVNVSSVVGLRPFAGSLAYCMSKSALDQFTRCVALELASKHVRVNSVNPGGVMTDFQSRAGLMDPNHPDEFEKFINKIHPSGRAGTSVEIAHAIAFLASDFATNITGVLLPVDGGLTLAGPM